MPNLRLNVERVRKVINNGVEEGLHAFVLEGGTARNGNDLIGNDGAAESGFDVFDGDRLLFEEHHSDLFIDVAECGGEIVISGVGDDKLVRSQSRVFVGGA